jgi:hypothetical protein
MRKLDANLNTFNIVGELVTMVVLELNGDCHPRAKGEVEGLVDILRGDGKNVSYEDVKHDNLVTESLTFLDDNRDLAILVKCANAFLIDQLNNGRLHFFILIGAG